MEFMSTNDFHWTFCPRLELASEVGPMSPAPHDPLAQLPSSGLQPAELWLTVGIGKQPRSLGNWSLGVHGSITKPVLRKWLEKCKIRPMEVQQTTYRTQKHQKARRDEFDDLGVEKESKKDLTKCDLYECHLHC